MYKIFGLFLLIKLLNVVFTHKIYINNKLRNLGLRAIVFKEKKLGRIVKHFKEVCDIYYNKAIVTAADGLNGYNELSEDEKTIIDAIISLYY